MKKSNLDKDVINKYYKIIGENVKKVRKCKNISQLELSQMIEHKSTTVISWGEICHKNQHFNIEHLIKISDALDVHICKFFEGCEEIKEG